MRGGAGRVVVRAGAGGGAGARVVRGAGAGARVEVGSGFGEADFAVDRGELVLDELLEVVLEDVDGDEEVRDAGVVDAGGCVVERVPITTPGLSFAGVEDICDHSTAAITPVSRKLTTAAMTFMPSSLSAARDRPMRPG